MNSQQLQILAQIFAANARILGMEAENQARIVCGSSPAFSENDFCREAGYLDHLAVQAANS